ncbi:MAG TPA: hypothetical protein VLN26_04010 [Gaiellaceae bacterium]|nr:hypothetical protein [Gaiellaceae bacterium]
MLLLAALDRGLVTSVAAAVIVVVVGVSLLVWLRGRRTPELELPTEAPEDERPLAERTAPPPIEPAQLPELEPRPEPEPAPVPGLEEPAVEQRWVPEAVRDLPRAEELPEWFVRLRTGAPLEPGKRPRRR